MKKKRGGRKEQWEIDEEVNKGEMYSEGEKGRGERYR